LAVEAATAIADEKIQQAQQQSVEIMTFVQGEDIKANLEDAEKIQEKIFQLLAFVEEQAIIPFTELDIKKMKGDWEGFYRLRI
jgi:mRNA-degrading endonuclease RelE of RelBE toxin-antitoxin system